MSDETENGSPDGLTNGQKKRLDTLMGFAGELEQEINGLIAAFEKKHRVSCWVSTANHNTVSIAISADKDHL